MATYYVSPSGSDANNGLGPDASHATNKPWLTIGKALASGTVVAAGDTVYIAPGFYYSANCVVISFGTGGPQVIVSGDPTNEQGFKDGSGVRLAAGVCFASTRSTKDALPPTGTTLFNLFTNQVRKITFQKLWMDARQGVDSAAVELHGVCDGIKILDNMISASYGIDVSGGAPNATRGVYMQRNVMIGGILLNYVTTTAATAANIDVGYQIDNNLILGGRLGVLAIGASGGNIGGGVIFKFNTIFGTFSSTLQSTALRVSTTTPCRVSGNVVIGYSWVNAGTAGQIVSDGGNMELGLSVAPTNFTRDGADTSASEARMRWPVFSKWGLNPPADDLFALLPTTEPSFFQTALSNTDPDWRNRTVRPFGTAGPTAGYMEGSLPTQDTGSQITGGGVNSLKIAGAGLAGPFYARVVGALTTISVKTKSSSYGGTSYPRLILDPAPDIGYAGESIAATDATEQTLTSASFTPTGKGVIRFWLESRSTSGASATYFDRATIA